MAQSKSSTKQPATRGQGVGQGAEHLVAGGQVLQEQAGVHEVEGAGRKPIGVLLSSAR